MVRANLYGCTVKNYLSLDAVKVSVGDSIAGTERETTTNGG